LDRLTGYWVLDGVKGLGKPIYQNDLEDNAAADGVTPRGSRASARQVFLPLSVEGVDRSTLLARLQYLGMITNPKNGPGWLYIVDGGKTYRLLCTYKEGMEGDEGGSGDQDGEMWLKTSLTLEAIDPYFESPTLFTAEYGFAGTVPFFSAPFFPLKLNANQVLSDISQPARNNFVLNPSAETDALNWTNSALGSTPSVISNTAIFAGGAAPKGDWVFQIQASAAAASVLAFPNLTSAGAPFTIGQPYTFHGWVYVPSGMPDVRPEIFFGALGPTITTKDQWVWFKVPFTAASTSDRPELNMLNPPNSSALYYADAIDVTEGTVQTPQEYIDGDQLFCHWSGTPHASGSFQDPIFDPAVITNPGTVESYPVIQVIGPGTAMTANNLRSGREFSVMLATGLGSGQVMTLDFRHKTARLDDGTNVYRYITSDDFWALLPGDNAVQLALADAAAGSKVIVTWNPRFEAITG
jgi:hypothetical protein